MDKTNIKGGLYINNSGPITGITTTNIGNNPYLLTTESAVVTYMASSGVSESQLSYTQTGEPSGFIDRTTSKLSFNTSTRECKLEPVSDSFQYFNNSKLYTVTTAITHIMDDVLNVNFLYWDETNTLTHTTTPWSFKGTTQIAYTFWNPSGNTTGTFASPTYSGDGFMLEERHGHVMDWATHQRLHSSEGTVVASAGFLISNYTIQTATNAGNSFSITGGNIADEDIITTLPLLSSGSYTIFYRQGSNPSDWRWYKNSRLPYISGNTYLVYNRLNAGSYNLTELTSGQYVNYYVLGVPSINTGFSYVLVPGQAVYSSLASAQAESIASIDFGNLPFTEAVSLYQITWRANSTYTNVNGRCRIEATPVRIVGQKITITGLLSPTNHSSLSNRTDVNSHPATAISTDTTNFNGILNSAATDVQLALDMIDDYAASINSTNFLSANTSFYTQAQANANFLSANTSIATPIGPSGSIQFVSGTSLSGMSALTFTFAQGLSSNRSYLLGNEMFGKFAGNSSMTGIYNTYLGYQTATASTSATQNVYIGYQAGISNTSGGDNVFIGYQAGFLNTASYNTFVGSQAGYSNKTGSFAVYIGYKSGYNATGNYNTAIGYLAGTNIIGGASNTILGCYSSYNNTTGSDNVILGSYSAYGMTSGASNVVIGSNASYNMKGATYNVIIGYQAGYSNSYGTNNTFIGGWQTGYANTFGNYNTFIGDGAGHANTTGNYNTIIGGSAGYSTTTGASNVFIGYSAGFSETKGSRLYISNSSTNSNTTLIYGEFDNKILRINGQLQLWSGGTAAGSAFMKLSSGLTLATTEKGAIEFDAYSLYYTDFGGSNGYRQHIVTAAYGTILYVPAYGTTTSHALGTTTPKLISSSSFVAGSSEYVSIDATGGTMTISAGGDGYYNVSFSVGGYIGIIWNGDVTLYKNNSGGTALVKCNGGVGMSAGTNYFTSLFASAVVYLVAGDTLSLYSRGSGNSTFVIGSYNLTINRVSI